MQLAALWDTSRGALCSYSAQPVVRTTNFRLCQFTSTDGAHRDCVLRRRGRDRAHAHACVRARVHALSQLRVNYWHCDDLPRNYIANRGAWRHHGCGCLPFHEGQYEETHRQVNHLQKQEKKLSICVSQKLPRCVPTAKAIPVFRAPGCANIERNGTVKSDALLISAVASTA